MIFDRYDALGESTRMLAGLVRNAIIADAIGVVELNGMSKEIESLVNLAADLWETGEDAGLDAMVLMILVLLSLGAAKESGASPLPGSDTNDSFPEF